MNSGQSELSKHKLFYEDIQERSYWREVVGRAARQMIRDHVQQPLANLALRVPTRVRPRRK